LSDLGQHVRRIRDVRCPLVHLASDSSALFYAIRVKRHNMRIFPSIHAIACHEMRP